MTVTGTTPLPAGLTAWIVVARFDREFGSGVGAEVHCAGAAEAGSRDRHVGAAGGRSFDRGHAGHGRQLRAGHDHVGAACVHLVDEVDVGHLHGGEVAHRFGAPGPRLAFAVGAPGPHVPARLQRDADLLRRRDGGDFGEAAHLHRDVAAHLRAVAELAGRVGAPGERFAAVHRDHALGFAGCDRVHADQALDGYGGADDCGVGAVPELALRAGAPRLDGAVREQRQAVEAAAGDRGHATEFFDFDGRLLAVVGFAVAELPFLVRAPGLDAPAAHQREGVFAAGGDRRHFAEPGDFDGHVGVVDVAVAEFAFFTLSPGHHVAVAEQREAEFAPGRDRRHVAEAAHGHGHAAGGVVAVAELARGVGAPGHRRCRSRAAPASGWLPAATDSTSVRPLTGIGAKLASVVPSPSCPALF